MRNLFLKLGLCAFLCTFFVSLPAFAEETMPSGPEVNKPLPPKSNTTEWVRVPFEKAENEVLRLFQQDLPQIEKIAPTIAIYSCQTSGTLPVAYADAFQAKLERALLFSKKMKIRACPQCNRARLVRQENGQLHYETLDSDVKRFAKIASDVGVTYLLTADLNYTTEDLELRVRLIDAAQGEVAMVRTYSAADVVRSRENVSQNPKSEMGTTEGDSLSRIIIGEIAFQTVLSFGSMLVPTIDTGNGSQHMFIPSADLLIGEKYDRGYKRFGFLFSMAFNASGPDPERKGTAVPFLLRVGPQYRYTFNPYSTSQVRYSINAEAGVAISTGFTSAFVGLGPEFGIPQKFSISATPMLIVQGPVAGPSLQVQNPGAPGGFTALNTGPTGKFGGLGIQIKGNINF